MDGAADTATGQESPTRPIGDQAAWRALAAAPDATSAALAWAPLAAGMIDGAGATAVFMAQADAGVLRAVAVWPELRFPDPAMVAAAETAVAQRRGVVQAGRAGVAAIAYPLLLDGAEGAAAPGAVVAEVPDADPIRLRRAMRRLQWGAASMRDALRAEAAARERLRFAGAAAALHAIVTVAEHDDLDDACRAGATDLAVRFDCDRASIGLRRRGRCRLRAISHTAQFARRMSLVRLIEAAMDEAVDQRALVRHPPGAGDDLLATRAAAALARTEGGGHVLTIPLYSVDHFIGAVLFERPADRPFTADETETLEAAVTTLAPVLQDKRRASRWLVVQAGAVAGAHLERLLGPGRLARKLWVVAALAVAAFLYVATAPYQVTADAAVEALVQRTVSAPFDGFIDAAPVRAGDLVAEGALLARLDQRDLVLERLRIVTDQRRSRIEYERAIADRDRAEARIRQAEIEQADALLALTDAQIARAELRAPFGGVVVSGDLSQSIGAAVARGEPLFTVAPVDRYRVVLRVDEASIADIAAGQTGALVVAALPDQSFPVSVEKITPVAVYVDGRTIFEVEAALAETTARLRPGMEGAARIDVDTRRRIAIWAAPIVDWLRLWRWRWLGW